MEPSLLDRGRIGDTFCFFFLDAFPKVFPEENLLFLIEPFFSDD